MKAPTPGSSDWMHLIRLAGVTTLAYFVVDLFLDQVLIGSGWTILWPLNGLSVAVLLMRPRTQWPAILVGIMAGTLLGDVLSGGEFWFSLEERSYSLTEIVISAMLLPPFDSLERWLRTPHLPLRFCAALLAGPGISGLFAALLTHLVQDKPFWIAFNGWATADALGIAATLPLALSFRTSEMRQLFRPAALPKTLGMLALAYGTILLIFAAGHHPLLFLLYPVLLLVDLMLSFAGASIANLGVCLIAVYMTVHYPDSLPAWFGSSGMERELSLQLFLGFHLVALLPASIVLLERRWMTERIVDANTQLTLLASLDGLTGMANRRSFDERLSREWTAAIRQGTEVALIMIDIDRFKLYNDHYGHLGGDACLRTVANLIATIAERPQDLAARYGGEEFAVLLPATNLDGAYLQAEKLRSAVFELGLEHRGSPLGRVTLSLGCACVTPRIGDASTVLLELADDALYRAKQKGRNTVYRFWPKGEPSIRLRVPVA